MARGSLFTRSRMVPFLLARKRAHGRNWQSSPILCPNLSARMCCCDRSYRTTCCLLWRTSGGLPKSLILRRPRSFTKISWAGSLPFCRDFLPHSSSPRFKRYLRNTNRRFLKCFMAQKHGGELLNVLLSTIHPDCVDHQIVSFD